ncbi:hypothetical protein BC829DRAFT_389171 [Chytridium lagenaria]|nr:hypothetical protein BC829DRAFT_389171 [Chytridium lagenaria]
MCAESLGDLLLIGTNEGLFSFDTTSQDAKIVPLSSRPFIQMQYVKELKVIVTRSGKHGIVSTHEYVDGTKFGRKQKFEKPKESSVIGETYLFVGMQYSVFIFKWTAHPYNRFTREKELHVDFIPKSADLKVQEVRCGSPVKCLSFSNGYVLCYENVGLSYGGSSRKDLKSLNWRNPLTFANKFGGDYLVAGSSTVVDVINHETGKIVHVFETKRDRIRSINLLAAHPKDGVKTSSIICILLV